MRTQLRNSVIRRLDYIQMERSTDCNQETGTEPTVTEQTTNSDVPSSTVETTTQDRPDEEITTRNTDGTGVPTNPTQTTTIPPDPVEEPVIDLRIIRYFIAFAVALCILWFVWIFILSTRRPIRLHRQINSNVSVNMRTLPILFIQKTVPGQTEIVGYKV